MADDLTVLVVKLAEPTVWQRRLRAAYGPLNGPKDPRIAQIMLKAGALAERADVTLLSLTDPAEALQGPAPEPARPHVFEATYRTVSRARVAVDACGRLKAGAGLCDRPADDPVHVVGMRVEPGEKVSRG